jgi:hypothetical protein
MSPDLIIFIGAVGILLGFIFLIVFIYRRIRWLMRAIGRKINTRPRYLASLRNLILILLWTAILGVVFFVGLFTRAYFAFTYEKPVAEIMTEATQEPNANLVTLFQSLPKEPQMGKEFLIKGNQWMLEGDILKWDNWLSFLGLKTRYRLTRLRGRYVQVEEEIQQEGTIYSLVEEEDHPLWRYLYKYGHTLPLVSTVYGNAVFQTAGKDRHFLIYVSPSGFVVREKVGEQEIPLKEP